MTVVFVIIALVTAAHVHRFTHRSQPRAVTALSLLAFGVAAVIIFIGTQLH